jgi:hypothetical protein
MALPVNGTAEIQKLYQYAGWNPSAKKYDKPGKPVEWIRVHNLPIMFILITLSTLKWANNNARPAMEISRKCLK